MPADDGATMDVDVAGKLTAYVMGLGLVAVIVDGLARRVIGAKATPLAVALPRAVVVIAVGLVLFAVALRFDPHPWLLFGIPAAAMAGVDTVLRRRARARAVELVPPAESVAAEQSPGTSAPAEQPSTLQTLLTIAVAFAVAFTARHYIIEAFTVPMSAMAPAVLGRHFNVVCERCGGRFTEMELFLQPPAALPCPGCGGRVHIEGSVKKQDRLLAEKLSRPARWDLAVFHPPDPDPEFPGKLLTRVVGLPGESVEIGMGDVFINGTRLEKPADRLQSLWFPVGDTAWATASPGQTLSGWIGETDASGPLLRYAYDVAATLLTGIDENKPALHVARRPVRDVCLVIDLAPQQTGRLELSWTFGDRRATVKVDRTNSAIVLNVGDETRSATAAAKLALGLAVRDGVVSALADGRVVATCPLESQRSADHVEPPAPVTERCALTIRADAPPARIRVWRDVHYFTDRDSAEPVVRARLGEPFTLANNAYFVLADDSGIGGDSRTYTNVEPQHRPYCQPGELASEMFVGVARWVYWPIQRARGIGDAR